MAEKKEINLLKLKCAEFHVIMDLMEDELDAAKRDCAHTKKTLKECQKLYDIRIINQSKEEFDLKSEHSIMSLRPGRSYPIPNPTGYWIEKDDVIYFRWEGTTWKPIKTEKAQPFEILNHNWLFIAEN